MVHILFFTLSFQNSVCIFYLQNFLIRILHFQQIYLICLFHKMYSWKWRFMYSNGSNILKFKNAESNITLYTTINFFFKNIANFIYFSDRFTFYFILGYSWLTMLYTLIFQSSFRFTVNCQEGTENSHFPPPLPPHPWLPIFSIPHQNQTFATVHGNSLTHQYHPKITVSIRIHSWILYGLDRWIMIFIHHYSFIQSFVNCLPMTVSFCIPTKQWVRVPVAL